MKVWAVKWWMREHIPCERVCAKITYSDEFVPHGIRRTVEIAIIHHDVRFHMRAPFTIGSDEPLDANRSQERFHGKGERMPGSALRLLGILIVDK
uniref:Uncharacterized protein n=1 Tax=Candidatus Kentrum sp. TC TaxID=2126339 RepID=A0A450YLQ2_9GAMM|nr:MAG: hypothetical protein BECKTC1821D_GA0114238_101252 [Candidatus Kentron sp. TC]